MISSIGFRVRCAERNLKASDIHRLTGIPYNTLKNLYYERSKTIKLDDLDTLCKLFSCEVHDILRFEKD